MPKMMDTDNAYSYKNGPDRRSTHRKKQIMNVVLILALVYLIIRIAFCLLHLRVYKYNNNENHEIITA